MEYKGYNGTIVTEDDHLILTHSGFAARSGGLVVDRPRRIPLEAVSGVVLKEANLMVNGWLTLGLGGVAPPRLSAGTAGSNPNTVIFRQKSRDQFKALHDWLVTVVEHNRAAGTDPSAVELDAAGETRLERMQANSAAVQKQRMTELLGDERPDIVAAAARMGWRIGGKRELKMLAGHLYEGETVRSIAQGTYTGKQGILVLTDVRLLFLFHGVIGQAKEDFPLRSISSVKTKSGLGTGELSVFASGTSASISGIIKSDLEPLANAIRQELSSQHTASPTASPPKAADDPYDALQKLASLRDAGVLTDEEFEAKKRDLLGRI
ncbi:SHOCT domain-containing protein [Micromonospora sp. RTP1Z1]|uniref:SHOCT domain-containing protein n=1 Tax=Micromonospora sp. RTP1Z1 TaxID=2994043 RepID=UPI0029C7E2BA|nr:SHOCT domain-containing protein [Micromonospora sp. RTP1Z1]